MDIPLNGSLKKPVNSTVCTAAFLKMWAGFGFQPEEKIAQIFLQIPSEFSKTFFKPIC